MPDASPNFLDALVLTGGGTGGHFFPAIALAEGARVRWPGRPICFVGAQRGIESRELPESSWPHLLLGVEGVVGRSPVRVAKSGWKLWRAVTHLKSLWRRARPKAVIGTGGYVARASSAAMAAKAASGGRPLPSQARRPRVVPGSVSRTSGSPIAV